MGHWKSKTGHKDEKNQQTPKNPFNILFHKPQNFSFGIYLQQLRQQLGVSSQWTTEPQRNCLTNVIRLASGGTTGTEPRTVLSLKNTHPEWKEGIEVKV